MKKTFILLVAATIFISEKNFAQQLDTIRRKDADNREFIQVLKDKKLLSEGNRHNGLTEGVWTVYWESGYPMFVTSYHKGKRDGVFVEIDAQGYTGRVENYKNDKLEGPSRIYQKGTSVIMTEAWYSEGKKHGMYRKNYPNGKPQEETSYNYDLRDGKTTWYYENGEKAAVYFYRNGKMDGEMSSYFANGKVSEYGLYKEELQTGAWKEFYENGNMKAEGKYENGKKEGAWKEYDEAGKLTNTKYHNGEKI